MPGERLELPYCEANTTMCWSRADLQSAAVTRAMYGGPGGNRTRVPYSSVLPLQRWSVVLYRRTAGGYNPNFHWFHHSWCVGYCSTRLLTYRAMFLWPDRSRLHSGPYLNHRLETNHRWRIARHVLPRSRWIRIFCFLHGVWKTPWVFLIWMSYQYVKVRFVTRNPSWSLLHFIYK